ncbi:MAG: FAD-dependent oxidoreductase [Verrucomicrobia bacterium]|nr:FAD-dependent oxidoreductase [Verrucomicrobiota bacterium]MCH8527998.1 FAD-dependent oxidoreductase [Kiritimatiellia bacterium]
MKEFTKPDIRGDQLHSTVCVVGGGMSGLCAAVASARTGAKTILVHDRPVLGGNASSEVRMWICGAHGNHNKETGILEELQLENLYRNADRNFFVWDSVLWSHAVHQPNLTLLLNTTCLDADREDGRVTRLRAWQLTSQTRLTIEADVFIDCSGDSILAAAVGALHRIGREAREEFGEGIAPGVGDERTMGNTLLIQVHKTDRPQPFTAPEWAYRFESPEDLPRRIRGVHAENFWWLELGGHLDTLTDAEVIRDDLVRVAYGVWDYIKNRAPEREQAENWALHFLGSLPGKRENRRMIGDHILTQHDITSGGIFDDVVGYGGWSMDDHHPAGLLFPGSPTIFHPAPSPYGIPFRCLYSVDTENLLMAGRNISATHSAMSSTRVMATCAVLGQAAGTAAALCARHGVTPRQLHARHLSELQQQLMDDDCWLPGKSRAPDACWFDARLSADGENAEALHDGWERDRENEKHAWTCEAGGAVSFRWLREQDLPGLRLVLDSNLSHSKRMACEYPQPARVHALPGELVRDLDIQIDRGGEWTTVYELRDNRKRLLEVPLHTSGTGVRVRLLSTWSEQIDPRLFSIDLLAKGRDDTYRAPRGETWKEVVARADPKDLQPPDTEATGREGHRHGA